VLALGALAAGRQGATAFNLGNQQGVSVLEVLKMVEDVTGLTVPYEMGDRRAGDPPILVGSSERIQSELGWKPLHGDIRSIVETAWNWHRQHPHGYT
jgi:UDP-glucose 4-epimerase